ncbi:MAG: phosphate acyltransferase PlsX [Tepidisphaeraceae bacterium]
MRAAVDVMGGDKAPGEILKGCWQAHELLDDTDQIILVGREDVVVPALAEAPLPPEKKKLYKTVIATQEVAMDESPVEAIRTKKDSSIGVMNKLCADGLADVAISAGNTGACVAASQLRMRTLAGVSRPGIAVIVPTFHGPVVVCDVGANIQPKPKHLQQYAIMASCYAEAVCGIDSPRVGLMSIGEEDAKGTTMVKESRKLLRDESMINFVGNIEGRDIFKGVVDVVVCDGFVGNIILKLSEGLSEGLFQMIAAEIQETSPEFFETFRKVAKKVYANHDWQEHGGAPLLGVGGYSLICHGRSEAKAIRNAIRIGKQLVNSGVNQRIIDKISKSIQIDEE